MIICMKNVPFIPRKWKCLSLSKIKKGKTGSLVFLFKEYHNYLVKFRGKKYFLSFSFTKLYFMCVWGYALTIRSEINISWFLNNFTLSHRRMALIRLKPSGPYHSNLTAHMQKRRKIEFWGPSEYLGELRCMLRFCLARHIWCTKIENVFTTKSPLYLCKIFICLLKFLRP